MLSISQELINLKEELNNSRKEYKLYESLALVRTKRKPLGLRVRVISVAKLTDQFERSKPPIPENLKSKTLSSNGWRFALPEMIIDGDGLLEIPKESITPISLNASTSLPTRVSRQKALELGERKALETKSWKTEE